MPVLIVSTSAIVAVRKRVSTRERSLSAKYSRNGWFSVVISPRSSARPTTVAAIDLVTDCKV